MPTADQSTFLPVGYTLSFETTGLDNSMKFGENVYFSGPLLAASK
jgi:hypothetical protein